MHDGNIVIAYNNVCFCLFCCCFVVVVFSCWGGGSQYAPLHPCTTPDTPLAWKF